MPRADTSAGEEKLRERAVSQRGVIVKRSVHLTDAFIAIMRAEVAELRAAARLGFAPQFLGGPGLISSTVMQADGLSPEHRACRAMSDFVKFGMLPIVALLASNGFPNNK